ncbi:hypothetical protein ACFVT6_11070 [Streptomyces sp. NPDC058049]|uniref:hypothetical protein n=1 Tax=Streptomyces sp. NPDC058049 TaxID=3346314 RepID=UPI0036E51ED5
MERDYSLHDHPETWFWERIRRCGSNPHTLPLDAPGPPWRDGTDENEIIVPEPERPGTEPPLRDRPDLGRTTVVTLE